MKTFILITILVIATNIGMASSHHLQYFLVGYQTEMLFVAIAVLPYPLFIYHVHGNRSQVTSLFLFSLYMAAVVIFVVQWSPAWHPTVTVGALVAVALAGAALLALAERQRARRSAADGRTPISAQRCLLYSGAAVGLSSSLSVPMLALPPLVCAVLVLAGGVAIAAALAAVEHRLRGRPPDGKSRA